MQANHQMLSNKACCLQLVLFTFSILIFTWQKLHSNLVNQISETILQFLNLRTTDTTSDLHLQISSIVRAREHPVSVVLLPSLKLFLPYTWFPVSDPSYNTPVWHSFQNIPLQILVVHTPFSTTHLGNHNCRSCVCFNTNRENQFKPSEVFCAFGWLIFVCVCGWGCFFFFNHFLFMKT